MGSKLEVAQLTRSWVAILHSAWGEAWPSYVASMDATTEGRTCLARLLPHTSVLVALFHNDTHWAMGAWCRKESNMIVFDGKEEPLIADQATAFALQLQHSPLSRYVQICPPQSSGFFLTVLGLYRGMKGPQGSEIWAYHGISKTF